MIDTMIWQVSLGLNLSLVVLFGMRKGFWNRIAFLAASVMLSETPFLCWILYHYGQGSVAYHAVYSYSVPINSLCLVLIGRSLCFRDNLQAWAALLLIYEVTVKINVIFCQDHINHYNAPKLDYYLASSFDIAWTILLCVSFYNQHVQPAQWRKPCLKKDQLESIPVEIGQFVEPMAMPQ